MEATGDDDGLQKVMTVADADFQLRHVLGEGEFSATAIDTQGQPCTVPQIEWPYLAPVTDDEWPTSFD